MNFTTDQSRAKRPCGITSFLPLGMSCRDRAEAFARSLQSRLRTLGSQAPTTQQPNNNVVVEQPTEQTWLVQPPTTLDTTTTPTNRLPDTDSFFDFDIEPDSPASPAEECEYIRLDESDPKTLTNDIASESGYVCSSPPSSQSSAESHVSSDGPFFDPESSEADQRSLSLSIDYYDCDDNKSKEQLENGYAYPNVDSDSCSESLPQSQSTTTSISTFTAFSSASNNTLQDEVMPDVVMPTRDHIETSQMELFKPLTLEFPKITNSTPEASPERDEVDKKETVPEPVVEHLTVTNEDDDSKPQRVRRCSSLKTGKTPPGTPGRKKFVRFADVLGLDLADVKTFMDEIPTVPRSAYADLHISNSLDTDDSDDPVPSGPVNNKILMPLFQQPGGMPGFLDLVREQKVCLENAAVTDPVCMTITGSVRVRNLDFNKSVHLRYSLDGWQSFSDFQANYIENSCDGFSDKFCFTIFGNSLQIGQRLEMAVRFSCKGEQFWDSNFGANYCFQCLPASGMFNTKSLSSAVTPDEESWSGTFY